MEKCRTGKWRITKRDWMNCKLRGNPSSPRSFSPPILSLFHCPVPLYEIRHFPIVHFPSPLDRAVVKNVLGAPSCRRTISPRLLVVSTRCELASTGNVGKSSGPAGPGAHLLSGGAENLSQLQVPTNNTAAARWNGERRIFDELATAGGGCHCVAEWCSRRTVRNAITRYAY